VDTTTVSAAPIDAVWRRLADASTWSEWGQWDETSRDREGGPAPDGVGAIRRFVSQRQTTVEEVVAFEPPADGHARFAYELLSGLPLRDYRSEVTLETVGGGTRIRWVSTFDGAYPLVGSIVRRALQRFIPETARRLAAAAADPTA
jgi:Polyketide cyclase / dehydrase and lipid transport